MEENSPKKVKKQKSSSGLMVTGICLILVAGVLIMWFFLRGQRVVTGGYPEDIKDLSLICDVTGVSYPIFNYDNSTNKTMRVSMIFNDKDLRSIGLTYSLYYDDASTITTSEAHNHAALGIDFGNSGFEADAFSASFSRQSDKMVMSLYANGSEFNEVSGKYFLAQGMNSKAGVGSFKKNYENQGFSCSTNE